MIQKLEHYGITGKTMKWIEAFLKHRTQFVVVKGSHSSTVLVTSGVPQGTVLGPTLFLIFINDIVNCSTSTLRLFADDCCVYRQINSSDDHRALDQDLTHLHNWSNDWQMSFNIAKCKLLSITNKRKPSIYTYNLGSEQINFNRDYTEVLRCDHQQQIALGRPLQHHAPQGKQNIRHCQKIVETLRTGCEEKSLRGTSETTDGICFFSMESTH